jgi:PAS domain S-box-containing protein
VPRIAENAPDGVAVSGREPRAAGGKATRVIMLLGRHGRTQWVNEAFTRLTGFTIQDMRGRHPGDVLASPETDPDSLRQIADRVRHGLGFDIEILNHARSGDALLMSLTCTPMHDAGGLLTGFISVETDLTAQHEAERLRRHDAVECAHAQALLADVLDSLPCAVAAYDSDEHLMFHNRAYAEMLPISARFAIPGRSYEDVLRLAAEHGQFADAGETPAQRCCCLMSISSSRSTTHLATTAATRC